MTEFGFDLAIDIDEEISNEDYDDNPYTTKINIPQYEIKGEEPDIQELYDYDKTLELLNKIEKSTVSEEQKEFLRKAATRHIGFNYNKVAEYYAHQDKEMQELMEQSALIIIDYEDAIKNGYAELIKGIEENTEEIENLKNEFLAIYPDYPADHIVTDHLSLSVSCHIGPGSIAIACSKKI